MTLVVVLLFGLGSVLIISAIQTDPATGKSTSVIQTAQAIWADKVNFSQPATPPATNGGGSAGPIALQGNASTAAFLAQRSL